MRLRMATLAGLALLAATAMAFNGQTRSDRSVLTGDPWYSRPASKTGEFFTFYYFNPDGDGIYRFGRLGKVLTERFQWRVDAGMLLLKFGNTGEKVKTGFRIDPVPGEKNKKKLTLQGDPREGGGKFEYFRTESGRRLLGADWTTVLNAGN